MTKTAQSPVIMQLIPEVDTGGAERTVLEMTEALTAVGGLSLVITEGGRLVPDIEKAGGKVVLLPAASKNPLTLWTNASKLVKLIEEHNVSLVHARSRAPAWSGLMAVRKTGHKWVTTYHGAYSLEKIQPLKAMKNRYNWVMASGDRVIANSNFTADLVRAQHQTGEDRLRVVHRGVDLALFTDDLVGDNEVQALRERWGVSADEQVILVPGRVSPQKGQQIAIEAAGILAARGALKKAKMILAGSDQGRSEYSKSLKDRIKALGIAAEVQLVGHCAEMPAAYKLAAVTVGGSLVNPEAFGRTAAESQALGCPVIASNIGAPSEVVRDPGRFGAEHATGWLVPPSDPDVLAEILEEALSLTDAQRADMRKRARKNVEDNFSADRMRLATLKVYDELLGTRLFDAFAETL